MTARAHAFTAPLPTTPVSAESLFGDDRWQLARGEIGHRDGAFVIDWSATLSDGSRLNEPRWRSVRETAKVFIWSLHSDPPPGRNSSAARTLIIYARCLLRVVRWMSVNQINRWAQLDVAAMYRLFQALSDTVRDGERCSIRTAHSYHLLLRALYLQRDKLEGTLPAPPPPLNALGRWREERGLPFTPDDIAVPLVAGAIRLIGVPADAVIELRDGAQAVYDAEAARGRSHLAAVRYACSYLQRDTSAGVRAELPCPEGFGHIASLNYRVARLYEACFIVVAYLLGARISEILGLEAGCVEWVHDGEGEATAYVRGTIQKNAPGPSGLPHRWVAPEPVVRAIEVLERLSAPWRTLSGRSNIWLTQKVASALRSPVWRVEVISINAINGRLNEALAPTLGLPDHKGKPWRLTSHQGRKTFSRFIGRRDRTGLAALSKHLGHVTRAMTDRSYVGTDFELYELIEAQAASETRAALEELLVAPRLGGQAGRTISERSPFRGRTHSGDLDEYISRLMAETDMRLGVCDWGFCLYQRQTAACGGSDREPNPVLRTQSTCSTCANFVVGERHRHVWEERRARNCALLERSDLDNESRALAESRVLESDRILAGLRRTAEDDDV